MAAAPYKGGLTADEVRAVQAAWATVISSCTSSSPSAFPVASHASSAAAGAISQNRRWEETGSMQQWPRYAGRSAAEPQEMPHVQSHSSHIFHAITGVVTNLENAAVIDQLLADVRRQHALFRSNISANDYQKFSAIVLAYLSARLGSSLTEAAASGLGKLLALIGREGGIHS